MFGQTYVYAKHPGFFPYPVSSISRALRRGNFVESIVIVTLLQRISPVESGTVILVQIPAILKALHKVRVGNEMPVKGNKISRLALDLRRGVVAVEITGGDEIDSSGAEDVTENRE